ncbi:MAG: outer membrane beta-barrel protein [Pseudobdellovibrionaceae bacterium]
MHHVTTPHRCKSLWLSLVTVSCLGLFAAQSAHAQQYIDDSRDATEEDAGFDEAYDVRDIKREPDDVTFTPVADRSHPEFEAKGMIVGKFLVFPEMEIGSNYTDNLYATEKNTESDFFATFKPSVFIRKLKGRHELSLDTFAKAFRFFDHTSENKTDYGADFKGTSEIKHDWKLFYGLKYDISHLDRTDNLSRVFTEEPQEMREGRAEVGMGYKPNRLGVAGTVRHIDKEYEDGQSLNNPGLTVVRSDGNFQTDEFETEISYDFPVNHTAFASVTLGRTKYDDPIFNDGAGTYTNTFRDSKNMRGLVGIRSNYKGIIISDIGIGAESVNYEDNAIQDVTNMAVDASVDWNVTKLTTLGLDLTRQVVQDNDIVTGITQTRGEVSLDHELRRDVVLKSFVSYLNRQYEEINREDDVYRIGLGFLYRPSPYLNLAGDVLHSTQSSTFAGNDFDQNVFMLRLIGKY